MAKPLQVDYLVIGAGVAGLRAAVELARHGDVLVVTKESVAESNTQYAQGGVAVATGGDDDIALHLSDTIAAGDGLVNCKAAETLVNEGPLRVAELIEWGARFDEADGKLLRSREAAHSLPRILHADGDATGAEIARSLAAFARVHKRIRFGEWTQAVELTKEDGRVTGADLAPASSNIAASGEEAGRCRVAARAVLMATGGAGQVYSDTTNPAVATGDGIALASEAGAELADMEFYQFHPTALWLKGAPRFLISEAVRGEGAWLRNDRGERFMERYHPLLEMAPRDVVARAIAHEGLGKHGEPRAVYLDMRHVREVNLARRFPGISSFLAEYKLDLGRDLIPVRPAAHYLMGGVRTDLDGRTTLKGLYAAGEAACSGVHGANRLASNSLLEGLVFGARAALAMLEDQLPQPEVKEAPAAVKPCSAQDAVDVEEAIAGLQSAMWADAGLLRDEESLSAGLEVEQASETRLAELEQQGKWSRRLAEGLSSCRVAKAILLSALARTESRGAHFRNDYPKRDDLRFLKHSSVGRDGVVRFEEW